MSYPVDVESKTDISLAVPFRTFTDERNNRGLNTNAKRLGETAETPEQP